ncbi:P80 family lipoprotein [Mycoplasma phocoenae]|uniref:P80 family lipoprotein n=2 Tax=Mycoplasma phocoenae TaxID=754517 RepID=A0A858U823_9MOLU|nr:P80 family lipoprotein [Mycoplasma phocoenae]
MAFSATNGNIEALFKKDENKKTSGGFDFDSITTKDTNENKVLKQVFDLFEDAIKHQAIFISDGKEYGSSKLNYHKIALNIGSTAGFSHLGKDKPENLYTFKDDKLKEEKDGNTKYIIKYLTPVIEKDGSIKLQLQKDNGIETNKLLDSEKGAEKEDYIISDDLAKQNKSKLSDLKGILVDNYNYGPKKPTSIIEKDNKIFIKNKKAEVELKGAFKFGKLKKGRHTNVFYFIPESQLELTIETEADILNKTELQLFASPAKFNQASTHSAFTLQGGSIFGVHANEKEDKGTIKFLKWLVSAKITKDIKFKFKDKDGKPKIKEYKANKYTGAEIIADYGSYIVPLKSTISSSEDSELYERLNEANKILFERLKISSSDQNVMAIEDISAPQATKIRKAIKTGFKTLFNKATANQPFTFDDLIKTIDENKK